MPVVPFNRPLPQAKAPNSAPKVDGTYLAIATAGLHEQGRLFEVADKGMGLVSDHMNDEEYDKTWVRSIARKGRNDDQMRALEPDLEAYKLGNDSDLVTYHKKPGPKIGDLVS